MLYFSSCTVQMNADHKTSENNIVKKEIGTVVSEMEKDIWSVFQDSKNNYWFGSKSNGVYKFNNKELRHFTTEDGLAGDSSLGFQEDKNGNIYFDTRGGVTKYNGEKLETLTVAKEKGVWKLEEGDLWFRGSNFDTNGPFRYDGEKLYALTFPSPPIVDTFYMYNPGATYTPFGIYDHYKDSRGHMWFGTASAGLCRYDGETVSWLYEKHLDITPEGGAFGIRSIFEDKNGDFWFCNPTYRYEIEPGSQKKKDRHFLNYKRKKGAIELDENGEEVTDPLYFMSILEDDAGDLWGLTYGEGLWKKEGEELVQYRIEENGQTVFLFGLYKDRKGKLFATSHEHGVYTYDSGKFEPLKL
ncbi:MAG: hypothetical protein AB8F74_11700 [Saprospiraceae bacterium]